MLTYARVLSGYIARHGGMQQRGKCHVASQAGVHDRHIASSPWDCTRVSCKCPQKLKAVPARCRNSSLCCKGSCAITSCGG